MASRSLILTLALLAVLGAPAAAQTNAAGLGAWQNPDIGFVYDLRMDFHDADRDADGSRRWTTRGFDLSTAELSIGADALNPLGISTVSVN